MKAQLRSFLKQTTCLAMVLLAGLSLSAASALAEKTTEDYRSDAEYTRLLSDTKPSTFYPDGNSGQLKLLVMCVEREDVNTLERVLEVAPKLANVIEGGSMCSPVHWAAFKGNTNMLAVLLRKGADVKNKGTSWRITPLHIARNARTVDFLVEHGAEVDAEARFGQTPLMWAAKRGDLEVARSLVKHGAKVNAMDSAGATAWYYANASGHAELTGYLVEAGAKRLSDAQREKISPPQVALSPGAGSEHPFAQARLVINGGVQANGATP